MDENTVLTEQTEAEGTLEAIDEGWNEGWGDMPGDGSTVGTDEGDPGTAEESEVTEADADQHDAEETDGGDTGDAAEGEAAGETGSSDQGETFTLKHLGEERTVGRDEVVALAQKGMDYDRIREKWDGVKDSLPMYEMEHQFLKELAESRGGDIESLIDETRTQIIIGRAKAEGKEIDASAAASQAVRARMQPAAAEPEQPSTDSNRSNTEVKRFLEAYPTVRAEDIPKEVWDEVKETGDLLGAYRGYENRKLAEDNKRLQKELEDAKQRQKNKERSTGNPKSTGAGKTIDPIDEGWAQGWN